MEEKYIIKRDREFMLIPAYWNQISHVSLDAVKLYGIFITKEYVFYKQGSLKTIFFKKDWDRAENFISKHLFEDNKYFLNISKEIKRKSIATDLFIKKWNKLNFQKFAFTELVSMAESIKKEWLNYDRANIFAWYVGGDRFKKLVEEKLALAQEDFMFLTTPEIKTAASKLEEDILMAAKAVKNNRVSLEKAAEKLSKNYGWIPFGYDGPVYWDEKHFAEKIRNVLKNPLKIEKALIKIAKDEKINKLKRINLIKKYKLIREHIKYIDKINLLALWTDERKKYEFELHYYYSKVLWELERRFNIPYKNLKYLFTWELKEIQNDLGGIFKKSQWRIDNEFMIITKNDSMAIVSEKKKDEILGELKKQFCASEIKGMLASKGDKKIYRAKVKILNSPAEAGKLKKGEFLIATMTTPDYILAMKKAIGFITDEGGVTCHAAIVAREMRKPCIIGTGNATKILKDGDMVEVDAEKGIVKIVGE